MSWERGSILTAPPFGYSPELPLRRPGGPKARPANSHSAHSHSADAALASFPGPATGRRITSLPPGIVRSLRRLKGLRQRLSLCRVTLAPGCDSRLGSIEDLSLIAELADDGSLIVIFIHPAGIDDAAAFDGVCVRLEQALRHGGVPRGALQIAVLHCDAAALDDGDATRDVLLDQPSHPLLGAAGLAQALQA